jgi:hypothetical protein
MIKTLRVRKALLLATALGLLQSCGSLPAPVLQIALNNVPMMNVEMKVTLTKAGKSSTVSFYRGPTNTYSATQVGMAAMMPSPSSLKVALDLPVGTSGTVGVSVAAIGGGIPPAAPTVQDSVCTSITVQDGALNEIQLTFGNAATRCP